MPLRSRMSGRAVATASLDAPRAHEMAFRRHREHHEPRGDDRHRPRRMPGSRGRRGRAPWRCGRRCGHRASVREPAGRAGLRRRRDRRRARRERLLRRLIAASIACTAPAAGRARLPVSGFSSGVDLVGDGVDRRRLHDVRRPLRQLVERVVLRRVGRPQLQVTPRQTLDAGRIFQRRPFGAQRRDGVALALHVAAHLGDALGAQRQLELDLVDIGRGDDQQRPGRRG